MNNLIFHSHTFLIKCFSFVNGKKWNHFVLFIIVSRQLNIINERKDFNLRSEIEWKYFSSSTFRMWMILVFHFPSPCSFWLRNPLGWEYLCFCYVPFFSCSLLSFLALFSPVVATHTWSIFFCSAENRKHIIFFVTILAEFLIGLSLCIRSLSTIFFTWVLGSINRKIFHNLAVYF